MLGIIDYRHRMRNFQSISSLADWCDAHSVDYAFIPPSEVKNSKEMGISCLYSVVTHDVGFLEGVPKEIALIIDHDIVDPSVRFKNDVHLQGRKLAFRRAFGGKTPYTPGIQVPYCHVPNLNGPDDLNENSVPDTIIYDLHKWLPMATQFLFLSTMFDVSRRHNKWSELLGTKIRYYFTGLLSPEAYYSTAELFDLFNSAFHMPDAFSAPLAKEDYRATTKWKDLISERLSDDNACEFLKLRNGDGNELKYMLKNMLPVAPKLEDFIAVFRRSRLFVTDHGDIADQDVANCIALGVPVMPLPRSPWSASSGLGTTLGPAIELLESEYMEALNIIRRESPLLGQGVKSILEIGRTTKMPLTLMDSLYDNTWSLIMNWVYDGNSAPTLSDKIDSCSKWAYGMNEPLPF